MFRADEASELVVKFSDKDAAALYSQLTGVLAGFAFAGMIMLVTSRFERTKPTEGQAPEAETRDGAAQQAADPIQVATSRALTLLVSAFFGLVAVSLAYALIGGDQVPERAAVEHVVAGAGFGSSALALLLSVFYLIEAADPDLRQTLHLVVVRISPVAVAAYIVLGVLDVENLQDDVSTPEKLVAAALMCVPIAGLIASRSLRGRFAKQEWQTGAVRIFATGSLVLTVLCAIAIPILLAVSGEGSSPPLPLAWIAAALGVSACGAVTLSSPSGALSSHGPEDAVTQAGT